METANPRWLATLAEGAALAAIGIVIKGVAVWLPEYFYSWKTEPRKIPLALLAIAWVLEWAGFWKLAAAPPSGGRFKVSFLQWLALPYLLVMLLPGWLGGLPSAIEITLVLLSLLAALIASAMNFWKLRVIAQSFSIRWDVLAILLGILAPIFFIIASLPELDGAEDSLSQMIRVPSLLSGSAELLGFVRYLDHPAMLPLIGLLMPILAFTFEVRLFFGLKRFRKPAT